MSPSCVSIIRFNDHYLSFRLALSSEIMTIIAGNENKQFSCHKVLLGYYSGFMEAAFYGRFVEAANGIMTMPEDDPDAVGAFISWW